MTRFTSTEQGGRHRVGTVIKSLSCQRFVPILVDGATVVHDSWNIAEYLEDRFPDQPSLFGGATGRATTRLINLWSDTTLHIPLRRIISADFVQCLCQEDRDYFRRSREEDFGGLLEQVCLDPRWQSEFDAACVPLERLFAGQQFIGGAGPRYADFIIFSVFQWARLGSPTDLVAAGSALARWRSTMIGLFGGLADKFPAYPTQSR